MAAGLVLLCCAVTGATERYVSLTGGHVPPFNDWAAAATNIQAAVDAASAGETVWVTNGTYAAGGRVVYGTMTNRVAVTKPLLLQSVNGPQFTVIRGYQVPGTTNGDGAIRCIYLTNGAVLSGFTLTNGATRVSGDSLQEESGGGAWCALAAVTVTNCVLSGNSAYYFGAGAFSGTVINSTFKGNSGWVGGGAEASALNNCLLTGNLAAYGGAVDAAVLTNCTLTGNSASRFGGGANDSSLQNCLVYYNLCPNDSNYSGGTLNYSCTAPLPVSGVGNLSLDPLLADITHLSADSPCRNAGLPVSATGRDIDGEVWANPPSIGCDEYWPGTSTGPLSVDWSATWTNVAQGFTVEFQALIGGWAIASAWDFGDGVVVSNRPFISHAWTVPGTYSVALRAWNGSNPAGVTATRTVQVAAGTNYVSAASTTPAWPFTSPDKAAISIQDGVDAAAPGALVLVGNGTYATGGASVYGMSNRVAVTKPIILQSINGPSATIIKGNQPNGTTAVRCVYLTNGAVLSGFTLTNGATQNSGSTTKLQAGGGVWSESESAVVTNCLLTGNSASQNGGGAYSGTLNACTVRSNSAAAGGGASKSTLNSCTLTGNRGSGLGGGAYASTLNGCLLNFNSTSGTGGGSDSSTLNGCNVASNSARSNGGGTYSGTLNNCVLTGNSCGPVGTGGGAFNATLVNCVLIANSSTSSGGGVHGGYLTNCLIVSNSAASFGGGSEIGTLNNCTVTGNSAGSAGGGTWYSSLNNCIVYFNTAPNIPNCNASPKYSCTTPMPTNGVGNFTNAPLFLDYAGGNLRLQSNSPCINAGKNGFMTTGTDLDGNPRIVGTTVDVGAYEFQSPASTLPYAWAQQYSLPTDGSADTLDSDGDGLNNWQESRCLTDPTNALSVLRLLSASPSGTNVTVRWQSVPGLSYFLERSTDLTATPRFTPLATNVTGQSGATTTFTDTNAASGSPLFYRVSVGN